jgi:hypothetical protein
MLTNREAAMLRHGGGIPLNLVDLDILFKDRVIKTAREYSGVEGQDDIVVFVLDNGVIVSFKGPVITVGGN